MKQKINIQIGYTLFVSYGRVSQLNPSLDYHFRMKEQSV